MSPHCTPASLIPPVYAAAALDERGPIQPPAPPAASPDLTPTQQTNPRELVADGSAASTAPDFCSSAPLQKAGGASGNAVADVLEHAG